MITALAILAMTQFQPQTPGYAPDFDLAGSNDVRQPAKLTPFPSLSWNVKVTIKEGRAAGLMFWADQKLEKGYSVTIDTRLGLLVLSRVGRWPEEERLATFPWTVLDGTKVEFKIRASDKRIRIWVNKLEYPVLEAFGVEPQGAQEGFRIIDAKATYSSWNMPVETPQMDFRPYVPEVGKFQHIFDQSQGEKETWYVNDHCFIKGEDGWHVYGITHAQPANPMQEKNFAHGTSPNLLDPNWKKQPFALTWAPELKENHLWAPHVIKKGDTYYMFYCAGSQVSNYHYQINLATSKDLKTWTRYKNNPLFQDFYDARDPMVLLIDGVYHMYYTANLDKDDNHHVVNVRTSKDLLKWSPAKVVFVHPEKGTFGGPTESPFVVRYGDHFYLFIGPDGEYHKTTVYRSANPYHWEFKPIYSFPSHAAEVIQDGDKWYASDAGWDLNGVFLAPISWKPVLK